MATACGEINDRLRRHLYLEISKQPSKSSATISDSSVGVTDIHTPSAIHFSA